MTIQAGYYATVAIDSLRGIHTDSANPVYKLAFMEPKFKYNPRHERWDQINYREIQPLGNPNLVKNPVPYPQGGYPIEIAATMIDGHFRLYPRDQSSITTLINYGFQSGWKFKSLVVYESKSGALVFAFDAVEAISGDYGGRFLKPKYVESKELWNSGPPLVSSEESTGTTGPIEFLDALALPPFIYNLKEDDESDTTEVRSIISGDDNSYYLAGTFTHVAEGRYAGRGAFDYTDLVFGNDRPAKFRVEKGGDSKVKGSVFKIIPDNQGGLFILGDFDSAGGRERKNICKYTPDFEVDDWKTNVTLIGAALTGVLTDEFLYIGGSFTVRYNSVTYRNLIRFNLETGDLDPAWNPSPNLAVRTLAIYYEEPLGEFNTAANKFLYVGGDFTNIQGLQVSYITRFNMGEFEDPPEIDPQDSFGPKPNYPVHVIEVDQDFVYVGGSFTTVSNISKRRIFRARHNPIDPAHNAYKNLDINWNAHWGTNVQNLNVFVRTLVLYKDYLFASTRSDQIADADSRVNTLCAFSILNSNQVLNFFPQFENGVSKSQIHDMYITDDKLYCVGTFQKINGIERNGAASFSLSGVSPLLNQWAPVLNRPGPGTSGQYGVSFKQTEVGLPGVFCVYPTYLGVFLGGTDLTPANKRYGLCKINSDGKVDSWDPSALDSTPNWNVLARHGGFIYAGTDLDNPAPSLAKHSLVRIDEVTGEMSKTWLVDPSNGLRDFSPAIQGNVYALKVYNNKLYVGFSGSLFGRNYIARFTLGEDITLDSWNANITLQGGGYVNGIDLNDDNLYITGNFLQVGGFHRENFAVLNPENAQIKSINANLNPALLEPGNVNRYPVIQDENGVHVIGSFTSVKRGSSIILDENYNNILSLNCDGYINGMTPDNSGGFYIFGLFRKILGKNRRNIAHIDSQFNLTDWNPDINNEVLNVCLKNNFLYVVGKFDKINGILRERAARFSALTGALDQGFITNFRGTEGVNCVVADNNWVYFGLRGSRYNNSYPNSGWVGPILNGEKNPPVPGGSHWSGVVRVSATTGQRDPLWLCRISHSEWSKGVRGNILDMDLHDGKLFVCGSYNYVWDFSTGKNFPIWNYNAIVNGRTTNIKMSKYSPATCFSAPELSGPATVINWEATPSPHNEFNIDGKRFKDEYYVNNIIIRKLSSIKVHDGYVYVAGNALLWGHPQLNGQYHRSSRVARFPINQLGFARPDPNFKVFFESNPNDIVGLLNDQGVETKDAGCTNIHFDTNGDLHLCTTGKPLNIYNPSGQGLEKIGLFNFSTRKYSFTDYDGYLKLDSETGAIKSFFNGLSSDGISSALTLPGNRLVVSTQNKESFDLFTSLAYVENNGTLSKFDPLSGNGTSDKKLDFVKVNNWLYILSETKFDSSRNDQFLRVFNTETGTISPQRKILVSSGSSRAKSLTRVGDFVIVVGGEMTRDTQANSLTNWGDFIDHGVVGGRKVIYYKIKEQL